MPWALPRMRPLAPNQPRCINIQLVGMRSSHMRRESEGKLQDHDLVLVSKVQQLSTKGIDDTNCISSEAKD